jgi:hypothetical protein
MGRAMLIICAGLLVALSYTFFGFVTGREAISQRNINTYEAVKAKNTANTGVQIAIQKYNEDDSWRGPETVNYEDASLTLSLQQVNPDTIEITSNSTFSNADHSVISAFDISQNQQLVPDFVTALTIANGNFNFSMGGSSSISGNDASGQCADKAGIVVPDQAGVNEVGNQSGISGNPSGVAGIDNSTNFTDVADLIDQLSPSANHISGNYQGDLGTASNPAVTFVDNYTKLTGGIPDGHGILVVRSGGELDLEGELDLAGNLKFNGLVIFENAYQLKGRGTPTINGSVLVGSSDGSSAINIDISGNINFQYDCDTKKYADLSVNDLLNTTIYNQLSVYE